MNIQQEIQRVADQETQIYFDCFSNQDAWEIGMFLHQKAQETGNHIVISIRRGGQQLFYYAMEGTTPDNEKWVNGKENMVANFFKSSYAVELMEKQGEYNINDVFRLDTHEYIAAGGSVPLKLNGTGVIGSVTVSGMEGHMDHAFVIEALCRQIEKHKNR